MKPKAPVNDGMPLIEGGHLVQQVDVWKTLIIFFSWMGVAFLFAFLSTHTRIDGSDSKLLWNVAILLVVVYFIALIFLGNYLIPTYSISIKLEKQGIRIDENRTISWGDIKSFTSEDSWQLMQDGFSLKVRHGRNFSISVSKANKDSVEEWMDFVQLKQSLVHNLRLLGVTIK